MSSTFPARSGPNTASHGAGSGTAAERNKSGTVAQESMRALCINTNNCHADGKRKTRRKKAAQKAQRS
jgi:hypothetical protein